MLQVVFIFSFSFSLSFLPYSFSFRFFVVFSHGSLLSFFVLAFISFLCFRSLSIAISRLSELFSELLWRVVGGTLGVDIAVDYLASDQPFQKRLGGEGGDGDEVSPRNPLMELLCDTLWGMDAMVSWVGLG